jgi:4-amino-4-deoxy-L-arabinose transferase-like glycosyltransferase
MAARPTAALSLHRPRLGSAGRRNLIILIIAVALALRLGFVLTTPNFTPYADARDFDRTAVSLAEHGHYPPSTVAPSGGPTALRPPAYPYVLAAAYWITGTAGSSSRYTVARVLSALISTLAVVLTGVVAWLAVSASAGIAALALAAVYPPSVTIGDGVLAEPLFTVLVLGAVASALMARRSRRRLGWAAMAGLYAGLACLARINVLIAVPAIAVGACPWPWRIWRSALPAVIVLATTIVCLAPWTIRDALVFHRFVPVTTQAGLTLAGTYNPVSRADAQNPASWHVPTMAPYRQLVRRGESEAVLNQRFFSTVVRFAEGDPLYVAKVAFFNTGRLLELQGPSTERPAAQETGISPGISDLDVYAFYVLGILALASILAGALRRIPAVLWLVPLLMAVSLIPVLTWMRYRWPIDSFLILIVAAGISSLESLTADRG